jgi:hypothetical protein
MGIFSNQFEKFTHWIDPATASFARWTGISNYFIKKPPPGGPPVMPDLSAIQQGQLLAESRDAALRYGRANTVLSSPGGGSDTGDKLGP